LGTGQERSVIYALRIDPLHPNYLYGGTAGNAVFKGQAASVYRVYVPVTMRGNALND
jgi:hypothetical protein